MGETQYRKKKSLYARAKASPKAQLAATILLPVIFGLFIFILWQSQALHALFHTDTFTLPLPGKIIQIIGDNWDKILENVKSTCLVAFLGLLFGSVLGYLVAVLAALRPGAGKGGLSVIGAFASIPVVALAPVMNNWTKDVSSEAEIRSMVAKILVVMLIVAADMCMNSYRGLTELKPFSEDLMKIYAAKNRVTLLKLRIPNSLPYVFVALKVAVPASVMTAIVSEYFAEYISGVGRQIRENIVLAQYSTAWAYIIAACAIGVVSYIILMVIQSIVLKRYH